MKLIPLALSLAALVQACEAAWAKSPVPAQKVPAAKEYFDLHDVRLDGGPFGRQQEMDRQYLLRINPDRLVSWCRREAGLEPKAPPYLGWESEQPLLPGHILGFYLSGASMMTQATADPTLRERLNYLVDELAAVQDANKSGYLLPVPGGKALFEKVAAGDFTVGGSATYGNSINGVFEPTYTWNKITLGLYQAYLATGNEKAKRVLVRTADWFGHDVLDKLDDEQVQKLLFCEHGSIHESFVDVYQITGDAKYLKWARRLCYERMLGPMVNNDRAFLNGYHANCSIPIYTGFERVYDYTGEAPLHTAAENFWNEVVNRRSWVIGGNSADEHFFDPADFTKALKAPAGPESCNSVNMLRLTEALYRTQPNPAMLDYYERVIWNHVLSAHEPTRGMVTYYTPMAPGAFRVYSDEFDSMWCCVGTGMEVPGKYARMVYVHDADNSAVDVNLFMPSELHWKDKNVTLRQDTGFPEEPATHLTITADRPTDFALRVRKPSWVKPGAMTVKVNGKPVSGNESEAGFVALHRTWSAGDRVDVSLPMHLSVETLPGNDAYVAVLYGPLVLSGTLGTNGLSRYDFWMRLSQFARKSPPKSVPVFNAASPQDVLAGIRPVPGKPLEFVTAGLAKPAEVRLIPFYQNHYQRYAIYFKRVTPGEPPAGAELMK